MTGAVRIHLPNTGNFALIDEADLALVEQYAWREFRYAVAHGDGRTVYMHRLIMGEPAGLQVDHINHDKLDNRRANLRLASHGQNLQNRRAGYGCTGVRGVSLQRNGRFRARAMVDGIEYRAGTFDTLDEAAEAAAELRRELMPFSQEASR